MAAAGCSLWCQLALVPGVFLGWGSEVWFPGLTAEPVELEATTSRFELTLWLPDGEEELAGYLEYATDVYDAVTIGRMARHFTALLGGIVADPRRRIADLPWLPAAERHKLLVEWNDCRVEFASPALVHERFAAQAARTPTRPPLVPCIFQSELSSRCSDVTASAAFCRGRAPRGSRGLQK